MQHRPAWRVFITLAAGAGLLACSGGDWVVAGALSEEDPSDGMAPPPPDLASIEPCPSRASMLEERAAAFGASQLRPEHIGTWRGTLSGDAAQSFPGSSVELLVGPGGAGTFRFVTDPPPSPDVLAGYLCRAGASGVSCGSDSGFVGGYSYPLARVLSLGAVFSFVVVDNDPWGEWCAGQAPVEWNDSSLVCGRGFGTLAPGRDEWSASGCRRELDDGSALTLDCARMYALARCACAVDGCYASFERGLEIGLELDAEASHLSGWLWTTGELDAARIELSRE